MKVKNKLKQFYKNLTEFLYAHRYSLYALWNTLGVNAIDVLAMRMIDKLKAWDWYNSSG